MTGFSRGRASSDPTNGHGTEQQSIVNNTQNAFPLPSPSTPMTQTNHFFSQLEFSTKTPTATLSLENLRKAYRSEEEIDAKKQCLICMSKQTKKKPIIHLPCRNNCKRNWVHKKCIFEWKEQMQGKGSCPLCRGRLGKIIYTPPDYLRSKTLSCSFQARKLFNLSPVPKKAGMVRCFLKVKNNPWWGSPFLYEFYLQKVGLKKYPHGPLPSNKSPAEGDILLMTAKKRAQMNNVNLLGMLSLNTNLPLNLHSTIDISMEKDFDRISKNYLGSVQATSFTGLEYTVSTVVYESEEKDVNGTSFDGSENQSNSDTLNASSAVSNSSKCTPKHRPSIFSRKRAKNAVVGQSMNRSSSDQICGNLVAMPSEIACIHYSQNRIGSDSGPRKMKIGLPTVRKVQRNEAIKTVLGKTNHFKQRSLDLPRNTNLDESLETLASGSDDSKASADYNSMGLLDNIDDFSSDDDSSEDEADVGFDLNSTKGDGVCVMTDFQRSNHSNGLHKAMKRYKSGSDIKTSFPEKNSFIFGQNKKPCWLSRIQAYSLDFNGRVTLPSNKNFQIEFSPNQTLDSSSVPLLHPSDKDEIILQFGKVMAADECIENVSVYTVDFKYPLSPLQALGICLSSCDRKFACA